MYGTFVALVRGCPVRDAIASARIFRDKWTEVAFSSDLVVFLFLFQEE